MRKFRNSAQRIPITGEINTGISKTLPNQAPTMRDLLARHAMGIKDNSLYMQNYSGDLPDLRGYEPHEVSAMLEKAQTDVDNLSAIRNQQVIEMREAEREAKRKSDLALLKELQKSNPVELL